MVDRAENVELEPTMVGSKAAITILIIIYYDIIIRWGARPPARLATCSTALTSTGLGGKGNFDAIDTMMTFFRVLNYVESKFETS